MAKHELDKQAYTFKLQEGHLDCQPCGNKGSLETNVNETVNNLNNQFNLLKTHRDMCTKENLNALKTFSVDFSKEVENARQVPEKLKKRVKETHDNICHLKAA
ncbi:MAG TPA: hypothetical protein VN457_04835 [Chlamydiales bacterium]|nr:hypothetical protein [Chlamydiales bacterium]